MVHLSWSDIEEASKALATKVEESGYEPTYVVGITVGGLVPLTLVAKALGTKRVTTISASSYNGDEQQGLDVRALPNVDLSAERVLLVDDISDTGDTLESLSTLLREQYGVTHIKTAALVIRKDKERYRPDFYVIESEEWNVFPWEKGEIAST